MQNPEIIFDPSTDLNILTNIISNASPQNQIKHLLSKQLEAHYGVKPSEQYMEILIKQNEAKMKKLEEQKQNQNRQKNTLPLFSSFTNHIGDNKVKVNRVQQKKDKQKIIRNTYQSKRKILPQQNLTKHNSNLEERLKQIQDINQQCTLTFDKFDRKLNKKSSIAQPNTINQKQLWFFHQFFYSNYDRAFYTSKQFIQVLQFLNMQIETKYSDLKIVLRNLPTPSLFCQKFIRRQRQALENHRNQCRQQSKILSKHNQLTEFAVHSIVLALHPLCGHLHLGSILAFYKDNQYMIKFLKPQLPTQKIYDINMSTQYTNSENRGNKSYNDYQKVKNEQQSQILDVVDNINYKMTAYLIKILDLKSQLIKQIRKSNDWVASLTSDKVIEQQNQIQKQKLKVNWLFSFLRKLQILIKKVLVLFRLRCSSDQNTENVNNNINSLLLNPIKIMSKEFDNSSDDLDIKASAQIKQIIKHHRQKQVMSIINKIVPNMPKRLHENEEKLIKYCLLMLADLRSQGKQFDSANNVNLSKLVQLTTQSKLGEEFNEVYERIYSIITKIKE